VFPLPAKHALIGVPWMKNLGEYSLKEAAKISYRQAGLLQDRKQSCLR
jgi:hypothetical protein